MWSLWTGGSALSFCVLHYFIYRTSDSWRGSTAKMLCKIFRQVLRYKNWFLFMCQITVLRVDLLGCIQPLIWLNLNSVKRLLVGTWLAYYISHFNEKHSDANAVCLEWVQMPLSWLMKAFDHTSTNWNLKKEGAIWTGICSAMNYLVHIIHKPLWREGLWGF